MTKEYIEELAIPVSVNKFGKDDIKLVIPEADGDYVPTYAQDVIENNLSLETLQSIKTVVFPWNTDQNIKTPLANGFQLNVNTSIELTTESGFASNVTNPDEEFEIDYEEITVV